MIRVLVTLLALMLSACVAETLAPGPGPVSPQFLDEGHWRSHDGFVLAFSEWPVENPKAVIIALHGMNDYGRFINDAANFWQKQRIAVYAFDQRGFGRTEGNGRWPGHHTMASDVRTFVGLIRNRHPQTKVFLLGESMGGAVATLAAADQGPSQADGLILVSPAFWGWSNLDIFKRSALWAMMQIAPGSRLTGRGLNLRPTDNDKVLLALSQDPFVIKATRVDATYGLVNTMEEAWKVVPKLELPTLLLYAKDDQIVPSQPIEAAADRMPNLKRLVCYQDGHHMLLRDLKADRTWAEIAAFVSDTNIAQASPESTCAP